MYSTSASNQCCGAFTGVLPIDGRYATCPEKECSTVKTTPSELVAREADPLFKRATAELKVPDPDPDEARRRLGLSLPVDEPKKDIES